MKGVDVSISAENYQQGAELICRIKPGKRPYVVFFLITLIPLCLSLAASIGDQSFLIGVFACVIWLLSVWSWVYSQTIELFRDRIIHHSWFIRTRTIHLNNIDKWSIQVGVFKYRDRLKPTVRLEIHAKKDFNVKPIIIPLKLFNKTDLEPLFDALPAGQENR
jgi:hypothetical protein